MCIYRGTLLYCGRFTAFHMAEGILFLLLGCTAVSFINTTECEFSCKFIP